MQGKIVRGVAGFYYVNVEGAGIYECKAKGIFRNRKIKPLPGDNVELTVLDDMAMTGNIDEIIERKSELIRPAIANADQAVIVFAAAWPAPNLNLLDRFLVLMEQQGMETIICFNKKDQIEKEAQEALVRIYRNSGCKVLLISAKQEEGIEELEILLKGKTTVLAGPSGVGKSTILNLLHPQANMETGDISKKIGRGRHTTRHSELFYMGGGTYLFDTPGFSSLSLGEMEKEELREYYPEFFPYTKECKYLSCLHDREPECAIKEAISHGKIARERYENYLLLLGEIRNRKKY
jgi:ribosome biogenesis GTPase